MATDILFGIQVSSVLMPVLPIGVNWIFALRLLLIIHYSIKFNMLALISMWCIVFRGTCGCFLKSEKSEKEIEREKTVTRVLKEEHSTLGPVR